MPLDPPDAGDGDEAEEGDEAQDGDEALAPPRPLTPAPGEPGEAPGTTSGPVSDHDRGDVPVGPSRSSSAWTRWRNARSNST